MRGVLVHQKHKKVQKLKENICKKEIYKNKNKIITCETILVTCVTLHVTHGGGYTFSQNSMSLAPTVREGKFLGDFEEKNELLSH